MDEEKNYRKQSKALIYKAVQLVLDEGRSIEDVAHEFDLQEKQLQRWINKHIRVSRMIYWRGHY
jgi:transposase-like protein